MTGSDGQLSEQQVKAATRPLTGGYGWTVEHGRKWSERVEANLARIAAERGVTRDELLAPLSPAEREAERLRAEREWRAAKVDVLLSRIPDIYRDAEVRTERGERWLEAWGEGVRHRGLVILGETGVGKTWEAYAITRRLLLDHSVPVSIVNAPDLVSMFRPNDDGLADVGLLQAAPVVVIDDLGAERLSEWGVEQFWRLADFRRNHRMPFILTSNLTRKQLRERYDRRLLDRLIAEAEVIDVEPHDEADRHLAF